MLFDSVMASVPMCVAVVTSNGYVKSVLSFRFYVHPPGMLDKLDYIRHLCSGVSSIALSIPPQQVSAGLLINMANREKDVYFAKLAEQADTNMILLLLLLLLIIIILIMIIIRTIIIITMIIMTII